MALIVLMPSTVVALVVLRDIWRRKVFSDKDLWRVGSWGLFGGILAEPLGFSLLGIAEGSLSLSEMVKSYFKLLVFGTLSLITPFFAIVFGIPCMLTTVAIGYLCSQPIADAPNMTRNTRLPKPPKSL